MLQKASIVNGIFFFFFSQKNVFCTVRVFTVPFVSFSTPRWNDLFLFGSPLWFLFVSFVSVLFVFSHQL